MKILIADDDEIIRKTFIEKIPWEENGYEVVGAAQNGQQAYEMALYTCPDIVLTDIEMPLMSGLELAEKLGEVLENCRIIFLTAYDSFDYAREALRLHACEYILKNSQEEEILKAVAQAAGEIRIRDRNVHLTNLGKELLEKNRMVKLLQDNVTEEECLSICRDMNIDVERFQYQVMVLKAGEEKETSIRPSESIGIEDELKTLLENYLGKRKIRYWASGWNQYQVVFIETEKQKDIDILTIVEELTDQLGERLPFNVIAGMGRMCNEKVDFSGSFDDAVFAVNDDSQGRVRFYRELGQSKFIRDIREYIQKNYADPELNLNKLSEQVYLTPTYISSLFKRYMNGNFKEYLVRMRMKEACRLLKTTDLKSYEISEMVGYPNPQYFSVLFKKFTGETPTAYHNRFCER